MDDKQFMLAIRAEDRFNRQDVSIAEYEAHVICMSKPFRKYYANVFVLNKVSKFIPDGAEDSTLVLQIHHQAQESGASEEGGDVEKGERSPPEQVWDQGTSQDDH